MSSSRIRASRIARLTRVNPAALATRWRSWQALPIIEFKRQTRDQLTAFIRRDFSERFFESDAADYEHFREEVLMYMRRIKGDHQKIRNVDYGDVALVKRRAYEMATIILWRKHRHLERMIRKYEDAMRTRDVKQIEDMCAEVERVAQSIDYKDHRRMHALHTAAEQAVL
jgi:hypothetical protein